MAQHLNTNQLHQMAQIPMLQAAGLNLTILNNQQHLGQFAAQPAHQGMYQIVQQPAQLQMQNVVQQQQHQFSNLQHMQQQHLQAHQPQHILVPQQHSFTQQQLQQQLQITQQQQQLQLQQQQIQQQQQQHQQQQQQQQAQQQQQQQLLAQQAAATNGKGKGKKKPKVNKEGVPAPKRATTAYINFTQWYRESIKKSGRTVPKVGEFGKECAAKWNQMTEEEKKPFTEEAAKDRDRYRREMEIYKPSRDANKPKRPGTAFMLFMVDFRKEVAGKEPEGGVAALAKLGGERWRNMTDEEKKPYCEKQNECKIAYEIAMEEYRKATGQAPLHPTVANGNGQIKDGQSELNSIGDSDTSEQLNNSLSNMSNNHTLDNEQALNNHSSQSPASNATSPSTNSVSPNLAQQQAVAAAAAASSAASLSDQQQSSTQTSAPSTQANGSSLDQLSGGFYGGSFNTANAFAGHEDSAEFAQQALERQLEQQLDQASHDAAAADAAAAAFLQSTQQNAYSSQPHYSWN